MILKREILTFATRMKPNKCKAWIQAARPQTLAASASPVLVACALAYRNDAFQWIPAVWCMAVAVLAQIAANFFNDYFDFKKGADTEQRLGQQRAVASGWITPKTMLIGAFVTLSAASLCGFALLLFSDWWLIFVGLAIALCVLAYTAGPYPLAYHGLGDLAVLLFYGVIPVCFTYYVQAQEFTWTAGWLSIAMGLLSVNILLVNNVRDREQDAQAGKRTTVVMFGRRFGTTLYLINALLAVACSWPVYLYRSRSIWILFIFFLMIVLLTWQDLSRQHGTALNRTLGITARNVLLYAFLLIYVLVL
ncbi:1,4-dihydroxy-2-naphthoate polyprenyltransferase [Tannerella forsythia]